MNATDATGRSVYSLQFSSGGIFGFSNELDLFSLYCLEGDDADFKSGVVDEPQAARAFREVLNFAKASIADLPHPPTEREELSEALAGLADRAAEDPDSVRFEEISGLFDKLEALEPNDPELAGRFQGDFTPSRLGSVACFAKCVHAASRLGPVEIGFCA